MRNPQFYVFGKRSMVHYPNLTSHDWHNHYFIGSSFIHYSSWCVYSWPICASYMGLYDISNRVYQLFKIWIKFVTGNKSVLLFTWVYNIIVHRRFSPLWDICPQVRTKIANRNIKSRLSWTNQELSTRFVRLLTIFSDYHVLWYMCVEFFSRTIHGLEIKGLNCSPVKFVNDN